MEITAAQFAQIEHCLPLQRGNVSLSNLQVLNAILYVAEHGCKWRGLPKRLGNWHTIYTRMSRWVCNRDHSMQTHWFQVSVQGHITPIDDTRRTRCGVQVLRIG